MNSRSIIKAVKRKMNGLLEKHVVRKALAGFTPIAHTEKEDVHIIGFPKSGTTLLQHVLAHLVFGFNQHVPKRLIHFVITEFHQNPYYIRFDKRCYFKSHELPRKDIANVIYIIRDGRDALLSMYHMWLNTGKKISLEELYSRGGAGYFRVSWSEHIRRWTENPYGANILFIKYEDLISNKQVEIGRILNFLGITRSVEEIEKVIELTSFNSMREMENQFSWKEIKKKSNWKDGSYTVRKGLTKDYKNEVPDEFINLFNKQNQETLMRFNYIES